MPLRWFTLLAAAALAGLLASSCGPRAADWRTYEEIVEKPAPSLTASTVARAPAPSTRLRWSLPQGWTALPAAGMRLGVFTVTRASLTGACTIIRMGRAASDLQMNAEHWLAQVGITNPQPAEVARFLATQPAVTNADGWSASITDLTAWPPPPPATATSLLAATYAPGDLTIFVKLTGPVPLLHAERAAFLDFVRSVRRIEGAAP